jgi:acetyltransferase
MNGQWTSSLRDGTMVLIRPIRPVDEPLVAKFHEALSDRTVIYRYFHPMALDFRTSHDRLVHICDDEGGREIVLVAETHLPQTQQQIILGIARLSKSSRGKEAELALLVADAWQNQGLGTQLIDHSLQCARDAAIERVVALIMTQNLEMLHLVEKFGFEMVRDPTEPMMIATLSLGPKPAAGS